MKIARFGGKTKEIIGEKLLVQKIFKKIRDGPEIVGS